MLPVKAKSLIPKCAEQSEFSEEICKNVIEFFYKDLRQRLSAMTFKKIVINNLGAFYIKERVLATNKKKYERMQEAMEKHKDGQRKEAILRALQIQLQQINLVEQQIIEDKEKQSFFYLHKQTLKDEQNLGNLAE